MSDLVGAVEAAEIIGVSLPTVKRAARAGDLKHEVKAPGKTGAYMFERSEVERYRDALAASDEERRRERVANLEAALERARAQMTGVAS